MNSQHFGSYPERQMSIPKRPEIVSSADRSAEDTNIPTSVSFEPGPDNPHEIPVRVLGPADLTDTEAYWNIHTVNSVPFRSAVDSLAYLKWRAEQYPLYEKMMGLYGQHDGAVVLDYGCGPGDHLVGFLAYSKAAKVIGVDVSASALALARQRLALHAFDRSRIDLVKISDAIPEIPLKTGSVDYIHCEGVLHHASFPELILREFYRILRPGAQACIMVYNRDSIWMHLYTAYDKMILQNRFPGATLDEAFARNTDGDNCPISRCYAASEFIPLCRQAGFKARFIGGYLSLHEVQELNVLGAQAINDHRLPETHRAYLRELTHDASHYPLHNGYHAGIGGVYTLNKPFESQITADSLKEIDAPASSLTKPHTDEAADSDGQVIASKQSIPPASSQLTEYFDCVLMLTYSAWKTEPRSNRYHYASRFSRHLPVLFLQIDFGKLEDSDVVTEERSELENLTIWHVSRQFTGKPVEQQASILLNALSARGLRRPLIWIYHADYQGLVRNLPQFLKVYHATEDYFAKDVYVVEESFRKRLCSLVSNVDLLVAVSPGVLNSYRTRGTYTGQAIVLANGCDYDFYTNRLSLDDEAHTLAAAKKIAIWQGTINARLDFDLLGAVIDRLEGWEFYFCGREDASIPAWQRLKRRPQVTYLGELTPEGLRAVCRTATVGIIPFRQTPGIVDSSLPLKAFEYAACGLPVVSISIKSLESFPIFNFANTPEEFAEQIERAASTRHDRHHLLSRDACARRMSYDARFDELCVRLAKLCDERSHASKNILVLYDDSGTHITTVRDHIDSFARHSRHNVRYAVASRSYLTGVVAPCLYRLDQFDLIVIHYSIRLFVDNHISPYYADQLAACSRPKILFIQDEYDCAGVARMWIRRLKIDIVYTCVPEEYLGQVYPPGELPGVRFVHNLTGYVSESLTRSATATDTANRPWVIGYRGRGLPYWYGDLGREKLEIGRKMKEICQARHIPANIEWREEDRIYGADWYSFVASCRAMLGTESGANVFDHDGTIRGSIEQALKENPDLSYEEAHSRFVAEHEGKVLMNQISPKVFEAIAHRTALILFEGTYSGVVQPNLHFIPLKKDFGNVDEVLDKVQDDVYIRQMTERAYQDVIASEKYSYAKFIGDFDRVVAECQIVSAPRIFVSSVTATLEGDSLHVAGGVMSPRYLPGNHIFSTLAETEVLAPASDSMFPAYTASPPPESNSTVAPTEPPILVTECIVAPAVIAADQRNVSEADVLGQVRTRTLVVQVVRRVWGRVPVPIRSLLRPATTTVRLLARWVWR